MKVRWKGVENEEMQYRRNKLFEEMTDIITQMREAGGRKSAFLWKNDGRTE